jgi:GMP synthase (glutamine-hydrolysing)
VQLTPEAANDALLAEFGGALLVHTTHSEAALELPKPAVRLASSEADPNSAFSFGTAAWGVQFHPEFDAHVMRRYLEERRELLVAEGIDADDRLSGVEESPDGTAVLRHFRKLLSG